jgi:TRAP-type mannitol/chloroaromatic compound transport system permease small subunit
MAKIIALLEGINEYIGRAVSWLTLAMVLLMFVNVVQRYVFASGERWQQELVLFMHAIVFLAGAGYCMLQDKQVRVDLFYVNFSKSKKAWVDMLGSALLLFPVCSAIMYYSADFIASSWAIQEASREYSGMQGVYIIKSFIWVFCITLMLQGVVTILRSLRVIRGG